MAVRFIAALAPAITFGSRFLDGTNGQFGVMEMIVGIARRCGPDAQWEIICNEESNGLPPKTRSSRPVAGSNVAGARGAGRPLHNRLLGRCD